VKTTITRLPFTALVVAAASGCDLQCYHFIALGLACHLEVLLEADNFSLSIFQLYV